MTMRVPILLAVIGQVICFVCSAKIPVSHFKNLLYREPPVPEPKTPRLPELEYVEQRLDNFNSNNEATFQMVFEEYTEVIVVCIPRIESHTVLCYANSDYLYYRNDEFFVRGGPIFIYVGGEWTISPGSLRGGHMFDMARELGAQMFYTEHRYYGQSLPTPDASLENLQFLNIEQALADLAHFIVYIRGRHPEYADSQVVLVGGSYSATMVAWFRQKYPHLAVGAWASSAPVLAKVDFIEYKEVVGASIRSVGGEECYRRLEGAFSQAELLIENQNFVEFSNRFRTCDVLTNDVYDIWSMFGLFSDILAGIVQYHRTGDIEGVCEELLDPNFPTETDLDAFVRWYTRQIFGNNPADDECIDATFMSDIEFYRNTSWDHYATRSAARQWFYQTCAEYGWYQTSGSRFQPFGSSFPVELYIRWCNYVYSAIFNQHTMQVNVERKNVKYGGMNPAVKNVYFTHGSIDPWRTMGIQTDLNDQSPADVVPGASHCADLSSNSPNDSPRMREVRDRIFNLVRQWIGVDTSS
ncbi:putative serine protease K12H4.7 [Pseudolycoriella hygida]|uniref:Serine protease K12H4.7 n=1 Tax=Pseudolycoriella hygida TaxID=35572 RepID=A0A9Q0MWF6_9DIPT|nr:putative serine protease K12H4.7 [Pseudolycoriella hygida]